VSRFFQNTDPQNSKDQSLGFVVGIVLCSLLAVYFTAASSRDRDFPARIILSEKINPNTASVPSLLRLPNIGVIRANAIVAYRRQFTQTGRDRRAFENCDDLLKVHGIGPKTAAGISKWLEFK